MNGSKGFLKSTDRETEAISNIVSVRPPAPSITRPEASGQVAFMVTLQRKTVLVPYLGIVLLEDLGTA